MALLPTETVPKVTLDVENETTVPVLVRGRVCGLPGALSVNVTEPLTVPAVVGANDMLKVQLAPAASVGLQVLLLRGNCAWGVTVALLMFRVALPVFVSVTVCGGLVVPTT